MTCVALLSVWGLAIALLAYHQRRILLSLWREPVLRDPVMIFESDDWGPGPETVAPILERLIEVLSQFSDSHGRNPVMTLGVVLTLPDTGRIRTEGLQSYRRQVLDEPRFHAIVETIQQGCAEGIFSAQLHGMEHFWPPAVLASAEKDDQVRAWLTQEGMPNTEDLPAHLQSRWIDASTLPSKCLSDQDIQRAVREEVDTFASVFGNAPAVVVPPTFIWNELVERAWADSGVQVIVTPGRRYEYRDKNGAPVPVGPEIRNGDVSPTGLINVVRNDYFEPVLGHRAEKALSALTRKTRMGRPTLFETHRFNFTRNEHVAEQAIAEVKEVIHQALLRFPDLSFLSTAQLARQINDGDSRLIETRVARRIRVWLERVYDVPRLRKLSWITGLALLAAPVLFMNRAR
jgi:hypothetical protein